MSQQVEPVLVSGGQGSGKTTYLREMHARFDGPSVFLTTKSTERKAHNKPPKRVVKSPAGYPEDLEKVRHWAIRRDETVQVIIDECQNGPTFTDGNGPTKTMLHEDRERGIKPVLSTQSPSDLRTKKNGYGPVQQCDWWVWVGALKSWHTGFFDANGLGDVKNLMPTEKYRFAVLQPVSSLAPEEMVVCRGETDRRFA